MDIKFSQDPEDLQVQALDSRVPAQGESTDQSEAKAQATPSKNFWEYLFHSLKLFLQAEFSAPDAKTSFHLLLHIIILTITLSICTSVIRFLVLVY